MQVVLCIPHCQMVLDGVVVCWIHQGSYKEEQQSGQEINESRGIFPLFIWDGLDLVRIHNPALWFNPDMISLNQRESFWPVWWSFSQTNEKICFSLIWIKSLFTLGLTNQNWHRYTQRQIHGNTYMFSSLKAAHVSWITELVFKVFEFNQVQS